MSETARPASGEPSSVQLWILWIAMFGAMFAYLGIALMLDGSRTPPEGFRVPPMLRGSVPLLPSVTGALSIGSIAVSFYVRHSERFPGTFVPSLLSWALAESIAIYGLVHYILSYEFTWFWPFWFVGAAAMLVFYPRELPGGGPSDSSGHETESGEW